MEPIILTIGQNSPESLALFNLLAAEGYSVIHITQMEDFYTLSPAVFPNLLFLDAATYSHIRGLEICRLLRLDQFLRTLPLMVLAEILEPTLIAQFFEAGADDLLKKPFVERELLARLRVLLRWSPSPRPYDYDLKLIKGQNNAITQNKKISLTSVEYELLAFLCSQRHRYFTAEDLLVQVWQYAPGEGDAALVRNHIRNLRRKLEVNPNQPKLLVSRYGQGYSISGIVHQS